MKKLYQGKGRRVHPAPAPGPHAADASAVALAMLPATLLALVAALTAEEQEVLAYLLSGGAGGAAAGGGGRRRRLNGPHQPEMGCGCFGCYKSFWARWDASPNRHLIHRIIDAVEEGNGCGGPAAAPGAGGPGGATRRGHRRRRRGRGAPCAIDATAEEHGAAEAHQAGCADDNLQLQSCCVSDGGEDGDYEADEDDGADSLYGGEEALTDDSDCANSNAATEKSAVGKLVRFIGEKVWAAWT